MNYQVILDMSSIVDKAKKHKLKLGRFGQLSLVLDIEANDPDDACHSAFKMFCDEVLEHSPSVETKNLLRELKYEFLVMCVLEL